MENENTTPEISEEALAAYIPEEVVAEEEGTDNGTN